MKKTITIFGALAIASSPAIASSVAPYKTQNFQNILQPTIAKANGPVTNEIITQVDSGDSFYFQARLNNSTYNGFPAFMNQIKATSWPLYFIQWIDDDDFHTGPFPELSKHTAHGFFHDPVIWANRLENHMGHFGDVIDDKSDTAYNMINGYYAQKYLGSFGTNVEKAYNQVAKTGKLAGIEMNFGFTYAFGDRYTVKQPNYLILTNK